MLHLWMARMDRALTETEYRELRALLPSERQARMDRQPRRKHPEVLCAYFLLRMALREREGWRDLPRIGVGSMGKPFFPDYPAIQFNLSHTDGAVAVALSETPVGVDIEQLRPVGDRTLERLAGEKTEAGFWQDWVRREARAKRTGGSIVTMNRAEPPLDPGEFYHAVQAFSGYAAGVATDQPGPPEQVRHFFLDDLL